jgi:hypothetical protein
MLATPTLRRSTSGPEFGSRALIACSMPNPLRV